MAVQINAYDMRDEHRDYTAGRLEIADDPAVVSALFVPGKLRTLNAERSGTVFEHRRTTDEWREAAAWAALEAKIPHYLWCAVRAVPWQRSGVLADPGSHVPSVKASIDGLRDAGVLREDDGEHVRLLTLDPPRRADRDEGLLLMLSGPLL